MVCDWRYVNHSDNVMENGITTPGDRTSTISTRNINTFNLANMSDSNLTKGKFVQILKQLNDPELFELFFQSQRLCLKTKGLIGQFPKLDVSKFQGLMKVKLNIHSDWNRWLSKLRT